MYYVMGQFKDVGSVEAALMEECAELIQVIGKCIRFGGDWDEIPVGKDKTRWDMVNEEMDDVIYQWNRLVEERIKVMNARAAQMNITVVSQRPKERYEKSL